MEADQNSNNRDAFSALQLRITLPQSELEMKDYFFTGSSNSEPYFGSRRSSGKKWSAFIIGCIDLGCACLSIGVEGRALLSFISEDGDKALISSATCALILSLVWFIAAWKLLESAYLRKETLERYQLARFWQVVNVVLLFVFIAASILAMLCLYRTCRFGLDKDTMESLQTSKFRLIFLVGVLLTCLHRVFVLWLMKNYISALRRELAMDIDSLPLQVL